MLKSIEGVYRQGRIELLESPSSNREGKVIVTFLARESLTWRNGESTNIKLATCGSD